MLSVSGITNSLESPLSCLQICRFLLGLLRYCCLSREGSRAPLCVGSLRGQEGESPAAALNHGAQLFLSSCLLPVPLELLGMLLIFIELLLAAVPLDSDSDLVIRKRQPVRSLQAHQ